MKLLYVFLVGLCFWAPRAQAEEVNAINYYAVDNSLDGQPIVGMQNVLRFYPVFAIRDLIDTVKVSVDYGYNKTTKPRLADKVESGRFWRVNLPSFKLGEAIQRIDVEIQFSLKGKFENYSQKLLSLNAVNTRLLLTVEELDNLFFAKYQQLRKVELEEKERGFEFILKEGYKIDKSIEDLKKVKEDRNSNFWTDQTNIILETESVDNGVREHVAKVLKSEIEALLADHDSLCSEKNEIAVHNKLQNRRKVLVSFINEWKDGLSKNDLLYPNFFYKIDFQAGLREGDFKVMQAEAIDFSKGTKLAFWNTRRAVADTVFYHIDTVWGEMGALYDRYIDAKDQYARDLEKNQHKQEIIENKLAREVQVDFSDTTFAGIGIRKADLKLEFDQIDSVFVAKILYRNYNTGLRHLKALDPAERIGIFRVRYIPFPIVSTDKKPAMHLVRPLQSDSPAVFEIGLSFGNDILPGDQFFMPDFSLRRFGIAFALTKELFSKDAEVIALVLTYDFNPYASLGVGFNFADETKVRKYASFGINKKAFDDLAKRLVGIFGGKEE